MKKIFLTAAIFIILFKPIILEAAEVESSLTCNYPAGTIPPVSHTTTAEGDQVGINLGFSSQFGGIGMKFELINKDNPTPMDILEAKSGAGAAWQYTGFTAGYSGESLLTNQAAGNSPGFQWGYSNDLEVVSSPSKTELVSSNWAPNPADTFNGNGVSPCPNTPVANVFDEGRPRVVVSTIDTSKGKAIKIENSYSLRSLIDQYWKDYFKLQALYLNRKMAKTGDLRVYIIGSNWIEGPVRIYDDFSITHGASASPQGLNVPNWFNIYNSKMVLLVWNVYGRDIGILIKNTDKGASTQLGKIESSYFCNDPQNYECGNISFMTWGGGEKDAFFPKNSERTYTWEYVVGTIPQLEEIAGRALIPRDGDFNHDGRVDILDLRHLLANPSTSLGTIVFDYNKIVEGWGK